MSSIENFDNLPHIKLDNDFNVDLSFLADLASADFAAENIGERFNSIDSTCSTGSTTSSGYGSPSLNPLDDSLLTYSNPTSYVQSPTCSHVQSQFFSHRS